MMCKAAASHVAAFQRKTQFSVQALSNDCAQSATFSLEKVVLSGCCNAVMLPHMLMLPRFAAKFHALTLCHFSTER